MKWAEEIFFTQRPASLYHYTTASGLLGILKRDGNEFWASAIGFSNDASEGRYATKVGLEVIEDHPLSKDGSEACKRQAGLVRSLFSSPGCSWEDGYVVSFCEKDNVLSQWRAYGGAASFSIGFRALSPDSLVCAAGPDMRLVRVEYDASEQKKRLRKILDGAYRVLKGDSATASAGDPVKTVDFLLYAFVTQWAC